MKDYYILAIETSCDETSVSIIKNGHYDISTVTFSQIDIHQQYGGVVPEIASRNHLEKITLVLERAILQAGLKLNEIDAFAVTYGPGLVGSLLIGVQAAKILSFIYQKPLLGVNHLVGHIYASRLENEFNFPLLALIVSGGHTELIYMEHDYHFYKIGGTLDDAVGETYDKVARMMGLSYPGGPMIDSLASSGNDTYDLPLPLDDASFNFSFSGLKSAVANLINQERKKGHDIRKSDLASSFQKRVVTVLVKKTMHAIVKYKAKQLVLAGGVAANKKLRLELIKACQSLKVELLLPSFKYCTDNAAMIGVAAYYGLKNKLKNNPHLDVCSTSSFDG